MLRHPAVLGASLDRSLKPNVNLWLEQLEDHSRLRALALKHGLRFLSCSFEKRTRPRLAQAAEAGVPLATLATKMRLTDAQFEVWLAGVVSVPGDAAEADSGCDELLLL